MTTVYFTSTAPGIWTAPPAARRAVMERIAQVVSRASDVRVVFAFGSFVGDGVFRDIDLGVLFQREPGWQAPARIALEVGLELGPGPEIDVIPLNDADTFLEEHVAERGTLVFERDPGDAAELVAMARSEAIDLREWRRIHGIGDRLGAQ